MVMVSLHNIYNVDFGTFLVLVQSYKKITLVQEVGKWTSLFLLYPLTLWYFYEWPKQRIDLSSGGLGTCLALSCDIKQKLSKYKTQ